MYKKLRNEFTGVLTGKDVHYGGSLIRPEATGYGLVYFVREMLQTKDIDMRGARVAISGSGNVAQFAAEKVLDLGGIPISMSDSSGFIYDPNGINRDKLAWIRDLKNERRGRLHGTALRSGPVLWQLLWQRAQSVRDLTWTGWVVCCMGAEYAEAHDEVVYSPASEGKSMWGSVGDVVVALPCATRE